MKFMVSWRIHEDKRQETLAAFSQMSPEDDRMDLGDNIKLIGRWHDLGRFEGVAIAESDDPTAIANWALNWNGVMDIEVAMVFDDEETRAIGQKRL